MKKITPVIIAILFFTFFQGVRAAFNDVSEGHENFNAIEFTTENQIIESTEKNFSPDEKITRGDFIHWTLRSVGYEPDDEDKKAESFCNDITDKETAAYFNKAIQMRALKVAWKNPLCREEKSVSKVEALRMIFFIYGIPAPFFADTEIIYIDVSKTAWFFPLVEKNIELNLLPIEDSKYFRPYHKITRGQSAELLYRAYQYINNGYIIDESSERTEPDDSQILQAISEIPKIDIFLDVWEKLTTQYYFINKESFSQSDLIYNSINGLVETVSDPYTEFQKPLDGETLHDALSGTFEGIGAHLMEKDNAIVIVSLIKNSPAERAGLKAKDEIRKIDDKDMENFTLEEIIEKIKGDAGTDIKLSIYRPSTKTSHTFTITREKIVISFLSASLRSDSIAYVELSLFGETTADDFAGIMNTLTSSDMKGLILDVRNNPGGYLSSVVSILEHFIEKDNPVTAVRYPNNAVYVTVSESEGELASYPVIVLVNEGSASAAEILAIGLQEHDLATVIGTQTFGKGTVQELNIYDDGSSFKITIAEWLSPKQNSIEGKGITPDIIVEMDSEDYQMSRDPQFDRAIEEIRKMLGE